MQSITLNNITIQHLIGKGKYGEVYRCNNNEGNNNIESYAIKKINRKQVSKTKSQIQHIFAEKQCLMECTDCKYIVNLIQTLKDDEFLYFLMELIDGEPLFHFLRNISTLKMIQNNFQIQQQIGYEILLALEFVHKKGFLYRDLKASNVLLDYNGHIKLIDFGYSKKIDDDNRASTFLGTLHSMSPEILSPDVDIEYGYEVDHWAFGVIIYELFIGKPPYITNSREEMLKIAKTSYEEIMEKEFQTIVDEKEGQDSSEIFASNVLNIKDLLNKIWKQVPKERLGYLNGFDEMKKHPYFMNYDINSVNSNIAMINMINEYKQVHGGGNNKKDVMLNESVDQELFKGF